MKRRVKRSVAGDREGVYVGLALVFQGTSTMVGPFVCEDVGDARLIYLNNTRTNGRFGRLPLHHESDIGPHHHARVIN